MTRAAPEPGQAVLLVRAFDRLAAAARREAGLYLTITSGHRSDAEQAVLWAANPQALLVVRAVELHSWLRARAAVKEADADPAKPHTRDPPSSTSKESQSCATAAGALR